MATRSGSKASPSATHGKSPGKAVHLAPVHVLVTHTFKSRVQFDRGLFAALRQPPRGIRLRSRVDHEDRKGATLTWQAPSVRALKAFLLGRVKGSLSKGFTPARFDPTPAVITSVFPFSVIRPNGGVILTGRNFGDYPGQFLLKAAGFKGGSVSLGDLQWGDTFASGIIPNIFGVVDQPARLQIVTADGRLSNEWPCRFTAAREVRVLPGNIFNIALGGNDNYKLFEMGDETTGCTMRIGHFPNVEPVANLFGGDNGTDNAICDLKNGWVYFGYRWTDDTTGINGSPFGPLPEPANEAHIELVVSWFHDTFSSSLYGLIITAIGPVGVPYQ
jgi:hypothetical protein